MKKQEEELAVKNLSRTRESVYINVQKEKKAPEVIFSNGFFLVFQALAAAADFKPQHHRVPFEER